MVKASALYMVVVIALVIGILCSSLIVCAYFYRAQSQRTERYSRLQNNLASGTALLLTAQPGDYSSTKSFSLFSNSADSVILQKLPWGIFDVGIARAISQRDTLSKVFSMANVLDSTKWAALYLIDEDRPVSVSGQTNIKGDVYIPKAGIKEAYVDNKSYQGDKRLVVGKINHSDKQLPVLTDARLTELQQYFDKRPSTDSTLLKRDSVINSFLQPTLYGTTGKRAVTLQNIKMRGNVVLFSDTTLTIDVTASLSNVIIVAKSIVVKNGFHGTCQLFATDSISVGKDCVFDYPSCLGVIRFKTVKAKSFAKIGFGENSRLSGLMFTYEKESNPNLKPLIDLGKNTVVTGQVYSQGNLGLKDGVTINGSVFTSRFVYQSTFTRFENYIINTSLDATELSPYYLTSDLLPVAAQKKKVLQWIEAN